MVSAVIYDCEGAHPTADELAFFRDVDPLGFILFADHCATPDAARAHVGALKNAVGRDDVLILIDQEGGRVARMKPPAFQAHQPMGVFGKLWRLDPEKAESAARLNAKLLGAMVADAGVNVNCVPMLDVPQIDSDTVVIGDRALAAHPDQVSALGRAVCEGSLEAGVLPVIKHLPGHGRALCDSHYDLPCIEARAEDLKAVDFEPFKALNAMPLGMTGHVVMPAFDPDLPATLSSAVIRDVIRDEIGFDGLLFSDDLRMKALGGPVGDRAAACLDAGCDVALCCNFTMDEKVAAAKTVRSLTGEASRRAEQAFTALRAAEAGRRDMDLAFDVAAGYEELSQLLRPALNA